MLISIQAQKQNMHIEQRKDKTEKKHSVVHLISFPFLKIKKYCKKYSKKGSHFLNAPDSKERPTLFDNGLWHPPVDQAVPGLVPEVDTSADRHAGEGGGDMTGNDGYG